MYDVPGADTGREWIEIQNTGSTAVTVSGWKLFEGGVNHKILAVKNSTLAPGAYGVIADTPEKFSADWPGFSGTLFESSFSLKNTGESLVVRDASSTDIASITYDPGLGAGGDGNTLNLIAGAWVLRQASPGASPSEAAIASQEKPAKSPATKTGVSGVSKVDGANDPALGSRGAVTISGGAAGRSAEAATVSFFSNHSIFPYALGLCAVIGIGIAAAIRPRKQAKGEYTIIEEKS